MQEQLIDIEMVWKEYRGGLKSFLHSKIANPDEVDDLLQDILIKTYQNLHTVTSQKKLKSWLFQIANHTIIDFYRKRSRTIELVQDDLWYDEAEPTVQQSLSDCIAPFVQALPSDSARLLTEIELKGRSQKAYAEELGVSYSTLKSRVQKSRRELKTLFESCCDLVLDKRGTLMQCDAKKSHCKTC